MIRFQTLWRNGKWQELALFKPFIRAQEAILLEK